MIQFAAPALLVGLFCAGIPILIHLLLRPRPRRVRFPALPFLRESLAAGRRAQRLRNWWLLLVRSALLACVVLLLAGPTCVPQKGLSAASGPSASVLVVDDSWSMRYQLNSGATPLRRAVARAVELTREIPGPAKSSTMGVVWADPRRSPIQLTSDFGRLRVALRDRGDERVHAETLSEALARAAAMLQSAPQASRRLIVLTDRATHAFRDVPPGILAGIDELSVRVIEPDAERLTNLALRVVRKPNRIHPAGAPLALGVSVFADGLDTTYTVLVREGERIVGREGPFTARAGTTREVAFTLEPFSIGAHALTVELEPADRLTFDQRRFVAFECGPRPVVWLVEPRGGERDLTSVLIESLLAPSALAEAEQIVDLRRLSAPPPSAPGDSRETRPALIVVLSGATLPENARRNIRAQLDAGATVVLMPASSESDADWPGLRQLLSEAAARVVPLETPVAMHWEEQSRFRNLNDAIDELTRSAVRRYVRLSSLREPVRVQARYSDSSPAIVSRKVGKGELYLLSTSLDPEWSDLGVRAAGTLSWLFELVYAALGPPQLAAEFNAGASSRVEFPALTELSKARVSGPGLDRAALVKLSDGSPQDGWPTDLAGVYAVCAPRSNQAGVRYAVNWPVEESDLPRISPQRLRSLLGVEDLVVDEQTEQDQPAAMSRLAALLGHSDPARLLPLLLLMLILLEVFLSARQGVAASAGVKEKNPRRQRVDAGL